MVWLFSLFHLPSSISGHDYETTGPQDYGPLTSVFSTHLEFEIEHDEGYIFKPLEEK